MSDALVETIKKYKDFEIKPFSKVTIGDPYYFQNKTGEDLVFEGKLPVKNRIAGARINLVHAEDVTDYGPFECEYWILMFYALPDTEYSRKMLDVHRNEEGYMPSILKKDVVLGCDTACFLLDIDGKNDVIHTGADGYYGEAYLYKNNRLDFFEITLSDDMMSEKELTDYVRYFFDVISEGTWQKPLKKEEKKEK